MDIGTEQGWEEVLTVLVCLIEERKTMAEAVVSFLIQKIDQLLVAERKSLSGVRREIGKIKNELDSMRAFLREADAREDSDEGVKVWVKQVREVAYDVEDVLDEFVLLLTRPPYPHRRGFAAAFLHKLSHSFKHLKAKHRIAKQIEYIKEDVQNASKRNQMYHFNSSEQSSSSSDVSCRRWRDPRGDSLLIEEAKLVGIDKPINELIPWLVAGESRLGVVSVVGGGGLGKTTLVRKLYDRDAVKRHFHHRIWITVSQTPQIEQIFIDMLSQLKEKLPEERDTKNEVAKLQELLKEFFQNKTYVIVFDDIWSKQVWNAIKHALPDNNCGSRIMVTTRLVDIASSCVESYGHVYKLEPLQHEDALALFCRKALRSNPENTIPPDLKDISENILRRCRGLPLAIVAIGGLLSTKLKTEWQRVYKSLATLLESNAELSDMSKILLLSYNDLPYNLKFCFLFLSVFPEDYSIKCMRVIRLWTAEGFVEERGGSKVEDIAEGYLNELINRNLVQVSEVDNIERVREFRVHDLIRELIVSKFREQNFVVLDDEQSTSRLPEKVRRLSIQSSGENLAENKSFPHLRSLFMFREKITPKVDYGFRLLRVLDLEGVPFQRFPRDLVNVLLLRYLSLRRSTGISEIPNWIGELQNLQTLDLKYTSVSELPIGILKLRHLRHLLVYKYGTRSFFPFNSTKGFKAPAGVENLVNLQKLSFLEANHSTVAIKELGRLKQLRRLGVIKLRKEDGIHLCSSIENMSDLRSLDIASIEEEELLDVQAPLSSPPLLLERLYMTGRLEMLPHWIPSLHSLVKLYLRWSRLRDDPLEALQDLPNLAQLELWLAYDGEHLCFRARKFQRLKNLQLRGLNRLKLVRVEEGAMLHLQTLIIRFCESLETVPLGIENLTDLKKLTLYDPSEKFKRVVGRGGEDSWRIAHIPVVDIQ